MLQWVIVRSAIAAPSEQPVEACFSTCSQLVKFDFQFEIHRWRIVFEERELNFSEKPWSFVIFDIDMTSEDNSAGPSALDALPEFELLLFKCVDGCFVYRVPPVGTVRLI